MKPDLLLGCSIASLVTLAGCAPEGEGRVSQDPSAEDPCAALTTTLSAGINTGDDVLALFSCVNKSGQFDAFEPVLVAMNDSVNAEGDSLLTRLIASLKSQAGAIEIPTTTGLSPEQAAQQVDAMLAYLESGAPEIQLAIVAEAIDSGVAAEGVDFGGVLGAQMLATFEKEGGPSLAEFLGSAQELLCHDLENSEECQSPLRDALRGQAHWAAQYDPANPDAWVFSTGDKTREMLDWLLYAGGDESRALESNEALAQGLASLAAPVGGVGASPLERVVGYYLPILFGDDPSTPYLYEGYPDANPSASALYGVTTLLNDPTIIQAMIDSGDQGYQLASRYYVYDSGERGYFEDYRTDTCLGMSDDPDGLGTVNTGFDQLIRILVAADIDYTANPNCEATLAILIPQIAPYLEVSNTKNLGALMLELFTQIPLEGLQAAINLLNNNAVVTLSNALCSTTVQLDDTEALQAAVYMEETMAYSLPLLSAITHSGQTEPVVKMLSEIWDTPAICEMGPTLRLMMDPEAPAGATTAKQSPLLPIEGAIPGANPHDQITVPLLSMAMDLAPNAEYLLPPLGAALVEGQPELVNVLMALGKMAHNPNSALNQSHIVKSESAKKAGDFSSLKATASVLGATETVQVLLETLADPNVRRAITQVDPSVGDSPLTYVSGKIKDGTFENYLDLLRALLRDAQAQLDAAKAAP